MRRRNATRSKRPTIARATERTRKSAAPVSDVLGALIKPSGVNLSSRHVYIHPSSLRLMTMGFNVNRLLGLGQANGVVAQVVHAVPSPQEGVTEDSKRAHGLGEVHAHEGTDARALHLQDVVVRPDGEVVAGQGEGEVGQRRALLAVDRVLAGPRLLGSNLLVAGGQSVSNPDTNTVMAERGRLTEAQQEWRAEQ